LLLLLMLVLLVPVLLLMLVLLVPVLLLMLVLLVPVLLLMLVLLVLVLLLMLVLLLLVLGMNHKDNINLQHITMILLTLQIKTNLNFNNWPKKHS
jgi:hypothetical protein